MSWDGMMLVLDSCYDFCDCVGREPYFYITGGDPILHRDFWRLAEELHARGAKWCIMGNPFHLTDEVCACMHALGCRKYQLSLDGANAATHDLFRKPGSFDETLRAAECIKRSGMWLALMSTVSSMNAAELPDMIGLAARIDADVFAFGRYCPTKGQRLEEFHMEPLEYRALLLACQKRIDEFLAAGCKPCSRKKDHSWTLLEWEQGRFTIPEGAACGKIYDGCHCGIAHMTVLPTGDVYACRRMESRIGTCARKARSTCSWGRIWKRIASSRSSRSATVASCAGGVAAARPWRRATRATGTPLTRNAGWMWISNWRICRGGVSPFGSARRGGFVCREPRGTLVERGRGWRCAFDALVAKKLVPMPAPQEYRVSCE